RAVLAALQVADRLVVHAERVGEFPPGDLPLRAQHRDPVVDGLGAHVARSIARSRRAATRDPDSRRAIRRSTAGAATSPITDHATRTRSTYGSRQDPSSSTAARPGGSSAARIPSPSQYIGNTCPMPCSHPARWVIG